MPEVAGRAFAAGPWSARRGDAVWHALSPWWPRAIQGVDGAGDLLKRRQARPI